MSSFAIKAGASAAAAFLAVAGMTYMLSPRVTDREAGLKIVRGALVDAHMDKGELHPSCLLPQTKCIQLETTLKTTQVNALEENDVTIRTKEDARIYGTFKILWNLDDSVEEFGNIYTQLDADRISELEPYLAQYLIPAAQDTYKDVPTSQVSTDQTAIGERIAVRLQEILHERGYTYFNVQDVIPSGVGLSNKANADLEQIVSEERKLDLLEVQGQVADAGVEIAQKQAAVTAAALESLRDAGVPEDQLIQAYYLQLMRDTDSVGKEFVPGPIPGTGVGAVSPR